MLLWFPAYPLSCHKLPVLIQQVHASQAQAQAGLCALGQTKQNRDFPISTKGIEIFPVEIKPGRLSCLQIRCVEF